MIRILEPAAGDQYRMQPTTFVYSSHNCCEYIHRNYLVQPALESWHDKRIVYLPMSEWVMNGDAMESQRFGWGKFAWYLGQFRKWGLRPQPFYWSPDLSHHDMGVLMELLANAPVVILGAGNTFLGMKRYRQLGAKFFGDPHVFCRMLHDRQRNGKLTVGFSAGADQLCSVFGTAPDAEGADCEGFGLARDVSVLLHHEWGRRDELRRGAAEVRHTAWFGLPNDSGLAINTGTLRNGLSWQLIRFVLDQSWSVPEEQFHIKTRQGMKIEHYYADGRRWEFGGGDSMLI